MHAMVFREYQQSLTSTQTPLLIGMHLRGLSTHDVKLFPFDPHLQFKMEGEAISIACANQAAKIHRSVDTL